jgi:quinoprotein glucose dehydrogenase
VTQGAHSTLGKLLLLGLLPLLGMAETVPGVRHPTGLVSREVSKYPDVRNCSAMDVDAEGNLYVVEVGRLLAGVDDARRRRPWIHQDMGLRTPQERFAMYERFADQWPMDYYTAHADRVVKLRDLDGDGIFEKQTVFADGFNDTLDGMASGILTWEGRTYFSCIPNLWLLQDPDDDGVADSRTVMHSGFGVRVSIMGHDLNSLVWGPDGMLYGSIGDRGFNVSTPAGKTFADPVGGCVFRMNPDGSDFELFYTRLRNPKALGFDLYGKLFTVDNDGNLGDQCTMTYLIEGGEKGWHGGHQVLGNFQADVKLPVRGIPPWTADRLWSPTDIMKQTVAHLPSGGTYRGGPSGMRLYPGIGLGDEYQNCFFVTNYLGALGKSGVLQLRMVPDKGGYKVEIWKSFASGIGASDCGFGYNGVLYVADFGGGWGGTNTNGRVVAIHNPETADNEALAESASIMKAGFRQRDSQDLRRLLDNRDLRIRQQAQLALARKADAVARFSDAVVSENLLTRLHGVWGLGQVAKSANSGPAAVKLTALLADPEEKVRDQAAQALGSARYVAAAPALTKLLADPSDQVRCLAAIALGKLKYAPATDAVYAMIRENNNACAYIRHSGMMALLGISTPEAMLAHAKTASQPERLVVMMGLRRLRDARIATFLDDADPFIRQDSITAIHETNIKAALPAVAELLDAALAGDFEPPRASIWQRLVNANYRCGRPADIDRLLRAAASDRPPQEIRIQIVQLLKSWNPGTPIDFATGLSRPIAKRSTEAVKTAVEQHKQQLAEADVALDGHGGQLLEAYGVTGYADALLANLANEAAAPSARAEALRALIRIKNEAVLATLDEYVNSALDDLRLAAMEGIARQDSGKAVALAGSTLENESASIQLKQRVLRALGSMRTRDADGLLLKKLQALQRGELDPALQFDVLDALSTRSNMRRIGQALNAYRDSLDADDPLASFRVLLAGGDAKAGHRVFHESGTALCQQCHVAKGDLMTAGPNLTGIGARKSAEYLLRAIIEPSADLAPGYAATTLTLKDGSSKTGFLVATSESSVSIREGEAVHEYAREQIASQTPPVSSMPPIGKTLPKRELRDLLAYLLSLK